MLRDLAPESHFYRVFDGFDDVYFFAKNTAGETLFFSRGILHHHGLERPEQMLGRTDEDLTPGPLAAHYREDDEQVMRSGKPLVGRLEMWFDDVGLPDWFSVNKFPLFDKKGKVIGVMGTLRAFQGIAPPQSEAAWLTPAMQRLRHDLTCFPKLTDMASACGMSVRQLQRSFHDVCGMSPRTYWMKCRIRVACQQLRAGRESIAKVAADLGFCDQSNFTQHFHRHTGQTPREFAKGPISRPRGNPLRRPEASPAGRRGRA
jgi:AraC-like DNA-binding protein